MVANNGVMVKSILPVGVRQAVVLKAAREKFGDSVMVTTTSSTVTQLLAMFVTVT